MLTFNYKITEDAQRDIRKIHNYLEEYKANKVVEKIYIDIQNLTFMPRANKTLYSSKDPKGEYRRMISGKYNIIYKIENDTIIIIRIFNHKQNYLNSKNFILRENSTIYKRLNKNNKLT